MTNLKEFEPYQRKALEVLGIDNPGSFYTSKIRDKGFQLMCKDENTPILNPIWHADEYKIDANHPAWPYLPYWFRFYHQAQYHTVNPDSFDYPQMLLALQRWDEFVSEAVNTRHGQWMAGDYIDNAWDDARNGAALRRLGYRAFRSRNYSQSEWDKYNLPDYKWVDHEFFWEWDETATYKFYWAEGVHKVDGIDSVADAYPELFDVATIPEISSMLNVTRAEVRVAIQDRKIPARKSALTWLIPVVAARKYWEK